MRAEGPKRKKKIANPLEALLRKPEPGTPASQMDRELHLAVDVEVEMAEAMAILEPPAKAIAKAEDDALQNLLDLAEDVHYKTEIGELLEKIEDIATRHSKLAAAHGYRGISCDLGTLINVGRAIGKKVRTTNYWMRLR